LKERPSAKGDVCAYFTKQKPVRMNIELVDAIDPSETHFRGVLSPTLSHTEMDKAKI